MDLFKFLKKKQADNLEALLKKAAESPTYRDEFLKKLLDEELFIITMGNSVGHEGYVKLEKDTTVNVLELKNGCIPIFTSTDRIFDKGIVKNKVNFIAVKGKELFSWFSGKTLMLNPYSDYGKEFLPDEIQSLLSGTYFNKGIRHIKIEKDTPARIGIPSVYPTAMADALSKVFSDRNDVVGAYLAFIHYPETKEPPHYIFGIDTKGDWAEITKAASAAISDFLADNEFVDFSQMDKTDFITDYLKNKIKPFYTKRK